MGSEMCIRDSAKGAASPVKLIYDFGGCEAGVDFVIANITIIKK